jgi:hypothetical protein
MLLVSGRDTSTKAEDGTREQKFMPVCKFNFAADKCSFREYDRYV